MTGPSPLRPVGHSTAKASVRRSLALALSACLLWSIPAAHAAPSKAAVEQQFQAWLANDLWPEAKGAGVSRAAFDKAVAGLSLNWDLPDLVPPGTTPPKDQKQSQAEFSSPGAYFSEKRLQGLAGTGRSLADRHASTLRKVEAAYGVPGEIIIAIWGREPGYGVAKRP